MNDLVKIEMSGNDWFNCYLHEMKNRKEQVMRDLNTHVQLKFNGLKIGSEIWVNVLDHSAAMENFAVVSIDKYKNEIELSYRGGIS